MNKIKNIAIALFILSIAACGNSKEEKVLEGDWECVSWTNESTGVDKCNGNVEFHFKKDHTYNSKLGAALDTGTYRIANDMLFVTPNDKSEFGVKLERVSQDTLIFGMNQAGEVEILTLVRQ